jgi:hypothetical protein
MGDAVRAANEATVLHWHEKYLPGHFEKSAFAKYGYQLRRGQDEPAYVPSLKGIVLHGGSTKYGQVRVVQNRKYYWQKLRRTGHDEPLVYTGETKQDAMASAAVTATRKGARLSMYLPPYVYPYRKDLQQPDKADELTRVTGEEVSEMARFHESVATRHLNNVHSTETRAA